MPPPDVREQLLLLVKLHVAEYALILMGRSPEPCDYLGICGALLHLLALLVFLKDFDAVRQVRSRFGVCFLELLGEALVQVAESH